MDRMAWPGHGNPMVGSTKDPDLQPPPHTHTHTLTGQLLSKCRACSGGKRRGQESRLCCGDVAESSLCYLPLCASAVSPLKYWYLPHRIVGRVKLIVFYG